MSIHGKNGPGFVRLPSSWPAVHALFGIARLRKEACSRLYSKFYIPYICIYIYIYIYIKTFLFLLVPCKSKLLAFMEVLSSLNFQDDQAGGRKCSCSAQPAVCAMRDAYTTKVLDNHITSNPLNLRALPILFHFFAIIFLQSFIWKVEGVNLM